MPWPDCAPSHSLPDGGGGNRPPSGQPNVPANSRQSGLRVPLAASSPRYLALTNIRRRSQSLPAATEDRHRPPSTPNRARTIALPCPYRPFRCCIVIPSVDLGLVAEDLDHRAGTWVHWVLYNIPGDVTELTEGIPTSTSELPDGTIQGSNDYKTNGYDGPCPIQIVIRGEGEGNYFINSDQDDKKPHKYAFTLYALGADLSLAGGAGKSELMKAMEGHILGQAVRYGKFQLPIATNMSNEFSKDAMGCGSTCEAAKTAEAGVALTATASE